jgi:hypothetical protein
MGYPAPSSLRMFVSAAHYPILDAEPNDLRRWHSHQVHLLARPTNFRDLQGNALLPLHNQQSLQPCPVVRHKNTATDENYLKVVNYATSANTVVFSLPFANIQSAKTVFYWQERRRRLARLVPRILLCRITLRSRLAQGSPIMRRR